MWTDLNRVVHRLSWLCRYDPEASFLSPPSEQKTNKLLNLALCTTKYCLMMLGAMTVSMYMGCGLLADGLRTAAAAAAAAVAAAVSWMSMTT